MKTIKEAAIEYYMKNYCKAEEKDDIRELLCIFKAGVELAQRWIPVEEELPEDQGHYFVKVKNSFPKNCDVIVCEFYDDNKTFYCEHSDNPVKDVTHWRPIEFK